MSMLRRMALLAMFPFAALSEEAQWIGVPDVPDPAVAKTFCVSAGLTSAVLRVTGVGYYEARINGRKVGRKVLDPTPTDYAKRVYYSTYDVSGMLHAGTNEVCILLGNGLYNVQSEAAWKFNQAPWRGAPRGIATLDLAFADGSRSRVATDSSWRAVPSPVAFNDFREGEVVLSRPQAASQSRNADEMSAPGGKLVPAEHPGAEIVREYPVVAVETLPDGSTLYDFGFNIAGWARIRFSGLARGDVVSIRYDERHPSEGKRHINAHVRKIASPGLCKIVDPSTAGFQTDRFVSAGLDEEIYEPRFTYNGFRYAIVKGARNVPPSRDVTGCFVRTAFQKTGSFVCDNDIFNKLIAAAELAYEGNFTDGIPTDCPHREKNGWLGDAAAAIEFAQYAYGGKENAAAYTSWLRTIADQQKPDGRIASIAPTSGWGFNGNPCGAGPAWGIALTTIPNALYRFQGDTGTMRELYPAMRRYADKLATTLRPLCTHGLGDWVAVKLNRPGDLGSCRTTIPFTSSAYAYRTFREMSEMAELLGEKDDAVRYAGIAAKLKNDFNTAFYKGDGLYENGFACGQAMALQFGLVAESEVPAVRRRLVEAVHAEDDKIDFGLLGSTVVFRALSEAGETDLAWKMIMNDTYPGFAHWIKEGATTLWESWKGGSSRNHIMFGDFAAWAYAYLAGVKPLKPGFSEFEVRPCLPKGLSHVNAHVPTPHGTIAVEWTKKEGEFVLAVEVPDGTKASVVMPSGEALAFGPGRHTRAERQVGSVDGYDFVDPMIGTEGTGTEYGGMMPMAGVPFGSMNLVPVTRTNGVSRTSFNALDGELLGFILTRQPAIWMGDWGPIRIWLPKPLPLESIEAAPHLVKVRAGGRLYELAASAHVAFIRSDDPFLAKALQARGSTTERTQRTSTQPIPNFRCFYATEYADCMLKVAVSLISADEAEKSLRGEGDLDFDSAAGAVRREWEGMFSRVSIDAPDDVKTIFYTALYHSLLYPRQIDERGRYYSAMDDKVHEGEMYTCFSLWDTYRAEHPLLTLVAPERVDGMMQSLVNMYREGGWLPLWPNPGYTGQMIGGPAEVALAEAYVKGFRGFDAEGAWEAVLKNATVPQTGDLERRWPGTLDDPPGPPETRSGLTRYMADGYVAADETGESVSRTLDYAFDDAAVASFAEALGKDGAATAFRARSKSYTNLWNAAAARFLPRNMDGKWVDPATLDWKRKAYTETDPQTARWCVPHDVNGLVALMGGRQTFVQELDRFFDEGFFREDAVGSKSVHGNETAHHAAYMYNRVGEYDRTCRRARDILVKCYSADRSGFDGNEDCGQMSAWYIFSALGFYPLDPASGWYEIGSPLVKGATLRFGAPYAPATLEIRVKNYAPDRWRVRRATLNGVELKEWRVRHADLVKGGVLEFEMEKRGGGTVPGT